MNTWKSLIAFGCACAFLAVSAVAAEKAAKLTCCQEAAAKGEDCKHKCCVLAHKDNKSCEKCNPNKEDLKLKKAPKKGK